MDYQEALAALEESVAHSPQEPTDAPRGPEPSQEPQWWSKADAPSAISRPTNRCLACLGGGIREIRIETRERKRPNP